MAQKFRFVFKSVALKGAFKNVTRFVPVHALGAAGNGQLHD